MIITIDGNIGAGKSTVLEYLKAQGNNTSYKIDLEPVNDWTPFLIDMYKNNKDAFEFQIKVWTDRCFKPDYTSQKDRVHCVERSPHFQWNVFALANYKNGKLNERQMDVLEDLYERPCYTPDLSIYLVSDPSRCMRRIEGRNRECENDISEEYIRHLHDLHEYAYTSIRNKHKVCVFIEHKTQEEIGEEVLYIVRNYVRQRRSIDDERM